MRFSISLWASCRFFASVETGVFEKFLRHPQHLSKIIHVICRCIAKRFHFFHNFPVLVFVVCVIRYIRNHALGLLQNSAEQIELVFARMLAPNSHAQHQRKLHYHSFNILKKKRIIIFIFFSGMTLVISWHNEASIASDRDF
ncbi:hypothetical protein, unlikely [Trypanosoma congolense IL3000]|uniref:Uncharacterized protein n=1 Tax=Trypanosoma congolense (strain IL3000) TaxID=1068625 RepID=F9WCS7_TRYCI|nr:hypothetical protein, unlikely [Trypanosoma congolense IL3000]